MPSSSSRRPPYPADIGIGNYGLMLVDGTAVAKRTQTLENVAPTQQEYGSAPIYKERTFAFKPKRGMGERIQSSHTSTRYAYGLNVWVVGGLLGKGPLTHSIAPTSSGSVRDFVTGLHSAALTQFILAGAYVLRRTNDTGAGQVVSDNRVGHVATSTVRYLGAYASPIDAVYVAWDDGTLRQYNGAAWNTATLPTGFLPQFLEVLNTELWAADPTSSTIRKVTGDPMLATSWGGAILVGDPSVPITAIRQASSRLAVFKADGRVYTINLDATVNDEFPGLRVPLDVTNGRTAAAWLDSLWFRMGTSFYRLNMANVELTPVGPELLRENASEVQGPVQAFAGYGTICGLMAIYSPAGNSYLLTYGNWLPPNEILTQVDATFQFADQFDGALVKWTGKQVTAMKVSGIAAPDTRLYVGFADGTWDFLKLVPNPLTPGSGAEFTLGSSKLYIPLHHAMFQADWKTTNGFSGFGPTLSATDYLQVAYRMDGSTAPYTSVPGSITTSGQRLDTGGHTIGHILDTELTLVNSSTADTPVLEGVAIHESVRPSLKRDWSGQVNATSHAAQRDGSTSRLTAEQIRDLMLQSAGSPGAVTLTLPDETVQNLSFFGYQETLLPRGKRNGLGWQIDFQATEFNVLTVTGTFGRFKGVTFGDLGGIQFQQLKTW